MPKFLQTGYKINHTQLMFGCLVNKHIILFFEASNLAFLSWHFIKQIGWNIVKNKQANRAVLREQGKHIQGRIGENRAK